VTPEFRKKLKQEQDPTLLLHYKEEVEVGKQTYVPYVVAEPQKVGELDS